MYVVCEEHLERALDEFVEIYEACPDVHILEKIHFTDWETPCTCDFCQKKPVYLVV